jgi:hypothetical protein
VPLNSAAAGPLAANAALSEASNIEKLFIAISFQAPLSAPGRTLTNDLKCRSANAAR